jgi:hypothetical protein
MIGYVTPIAVLHVRQRPRNTTQLATGMFSNHFSVRPHFVQCEAGHAKDSLRGKR